MDRAFGIAAVVLGIAGLVGFPVWYASLAFGLAAVVLGWCARRNPATRRVATVGMTLGWFSAAVGAVVLLVLTPVSTAVNTGDQTTNDIPMPVGEVVVAVAGVLLVAAVAAWLILRAHRRKVASNPLLQAP